MMQWLARFYSGRLAKAMILGLFMAALAAPVVAQSLPVGNQWASPERIPGYDDNAVVPYLVVDQNRTVHAFNSIEMEPGSNEVVIMYSQWTALSGWTPPTDVLLSPWKQQARLRGVFLDDEMMVHSIFFGGDELQAAYFYSKAPLSDAGRAPAWSSRRLIGDVAITPSVAALTGDGKGNLVAVYSGNRDGVGLYAVYSSNGGESWTDPHIAFLPRVESHWPWALRLLLDEQNRLHAVWTMVNRQGNGDVIYHAYMDLEDRQWSEATVLATRDPGDYEVDWPSIVEYNDELILIYNDSFPATRFMRRSIDGGLTWSEPVRPFDYIGEYLHASFVKDNEGFLHMFLGNRSTANTHGMWHSVWLGDRWSELEAIISGPRITSGPVSARFDPTGPLAVLVQGNVLLVTWSTDPGAGRNGVWFSHTTLDSPELPVETLPPPPQREVVISTPTPAPVADVPVAVNPAIATGEETGSAPAVPGTEIVIVAAIIPAILLIAVVLFIFRSR